MKLMRIVNQKESFIGTIRVPVCQLKDQKLQEEWFILEDISGALGDINRRVNIQLQWIHSKVFDSSNIIGGHDRRLPA
jgi:hypothetical protein